MRIEQTYYGTNAQRLSSIFLDSFREGEGMKRLWLLLAVLILFSLFQVGCTPGEKNETVGQETKNGSNVNFSKDKPSSDSSQELSSLKIELDTVRSENADLQEKLGQLQDEKRELEMRLKEWEGLIPHQGIGEFWIEGEVLAVDEENRIITIEQHFDHNSLQVDPNIYILPQAFIQERLVDLSPIKVLDVNNRMGSLKESIQVGDVVGLLYRQVDKVAKFIKVDTVQKKKN